MVPDEPFFNRDIMNILCKYITGFIFLLGGVQNATSQDIDDLDFSQMIQPVDTSTFIKDSQWYNWCNSVVQGEDGKYHLFYARFPKSKGFSSWLVYSEIVHAVGEKVSGPYRYYENVLHPRKDKWDALNTHNVKIKRLGNYYYLYYISTNWHGISVPLSDSLLLEVSKKGFSHPLWMAIRNNQRSGVAISSSVYGPWKRLDHPIVEPHGPIKNVTVNPDVTEGHDGKYHIIVKGDDIKENRYARLIQAVGIAETPVGPFQLFNESAFDDIPTEDACIWFDKKRNRYYAIFHALGQNFIGLITSTDGRNWTKAKNFVVCKKELKLKNGSILKLDRMERPSVYIEKGELKMLSFAAMKGDESFIVFLPVK